MLSNTSLSRFTPLQDVPNGKGAVDKGKGLDVPSSTTATYGAETCCSGGSCCIVEDNRYGSGGGLCSVTEVGFDASFGKYNARRKYKGICMGVRACRGER